MSGVIWIVNQLETAQAEPVDGGLHATDLLQIDHNEAPANVVVPYGVGQLRDLTSQKDYVTEVGSRINTVPVADADDRGGGGHKLSPAVENVRAVPAPASSFPTNMQNRPLGPPQPARTRIAVEASSGSGTVSDANSEPNWSDAESAQKAKRMKTTSMPVNKQPINRKRKNIATKQQVAMDKYAQLQERSILKMIKEQQAWATREFERQRKWEGQMFSSFQVKFKETTSKFLDGLLSAVNRPSVNDGPSTALQTSTLATPPQHHQQQQQPSVVVKPEPQATSSCTFATSTAPSSAHADTIKNPSPEEPRLSASSLTRQPVADSAAPTLPHGQSGLCPLQPIVRKIVLTNLGLGLYNSVK